MSIRRIGRLLTLGFVLGLLLLSLAGTEKTFAQQAALVWNPNPEPDIAAYIVRYGIASGSYSWAVNVGNATSMTLTNLMIGPTYYFVVSAVNLVGLESEPSIEVSYTPQPPDPPPPLPPGPVPEPPVVTNHTVQVLANDGLQLPVGLQPDDRNNVGGGSTPFTRVYPHGSLVALTAPDTFAGKRFAYWALDGVPLSSESRVFVVIESDLTLEAGYLDDHLVGHWKFDEGEGVIARDRSLNGHHASLIKGTLWTSGVYQGAAAAFDGINDVVAVPDHDQLEFAGQHFTLAMWVRTQRVTSQALVEKQHNSTAGMFFFALNRHPAVQGAFSIYTGNAWLDSTSRGIADGTWQHLAVTYDAEGFKLYRNGSLDGSWLLNSAYQPTASPLLFGFSASILGNWPFEGDLDDVRLYHRALAQEELADLIAAQAWSTLLLRAQIRPADGQLQLVVYSSDGDPIRPWLLRRLDILTSEDPAAPIGQWTPLPPPFLEDGVAIAMDPDAAAGPQRFYLLRERPD